MLAYLNLRNERIDLLFALEISHSFNLDYTLRFTASSAFLIHWTSRCWGHAFIHDLKMNILLVRVLTLPFSFLKPQRSILGECFFWFQLFGMRDNLRGAFASILDFGWIKKNSFLGIANMWSAISKVISLCDYDWLNRWFALLINWNLHRVITASALNCTRLRRRENLTS